MVNVVSLGAVAAVPVLPAYSVSKAALLSVTQSLRALLAGLADENPSRSLEAVGDAVLPLLRGLNSQTVT